MNIRKSLHKPIYLILIALLLPLLAFISGCGGDDPITPEETVRVSSVTVSVDGDSVLIRWETDVPADSRVDYGGTTSYGLNTTDATPTTQHAVTLTGLSFETTYHFRATSADGYFCKTPRKGIFQESDKSNLLWDELTSSCQNPHNTLKTQAFSSCPKEESQNVHLLRRPISMSQNMSHNSIRIES